MDDGDDPLAQDYQARDIEGRTVEEALAAEFEKNGELLTDILNAKDRHEGRVTTHGTHQPTAKTPGTTPAVAPDPATQTAAERFRGKKPAQKRAEVKEGARIFPRLKFRANDPSSVRGWGK